MMRTVTRFGGGESGDAALAKLMLALLFSIKGTVLLYQGEELGLPEVTLRRNQLKDPIGDLYYPLFKGRDGCRTPMPWDSAAPNLGFTTGAPWLPLGPRTSRAGRFGAGTRQRIRAALCAAVSCCAQRERRLAPGRDGISRCAGSGAGVCAHA